MIYMHMYTLHNAIQLRLVSLIDSAVKHMCTRVNAYMCMSMCIYSSISYIRDMVSEGEHMPGKSLASTMPCKLDVKACRDAQHLVRCCKVALNYCMLAVLRHIHIAGL